MKQKIHMTPDEFRTYVASEVESIRSEIERLRSTAEHLNGPSESRKATEPAPTASTMSFVAPHSLPDHHKVTRG